MDPTTAPGWEVHGIVLGVLVAIGIVATIIDRATPSRGGFISLDGILSFFVWIGLGIFAAASTITFAAFRQSWGTFPCYLAALPLTATPLIFIRGRERLENARRYREQKAELVQRFELLSWSRQDLEKGRFRLDSEIRALTDLDVEFGGYGTGMRAHAATSMPTKPEKIRVAAGGTARLSAVLEYPQELPSPVGQVLQFVTCVAGREEGFTLYDPKVDRDVSAGEMCVHRPLPPARPPV